MEILCWSGIHIVSMRHTISFKETHGKIPTQIVYYDEVRRGTKIEDVDRNINPKLKPVD